MGSWVHRLSNIDPELKRADCLSCGHTDIYYSSKGRSRRVWVCKTNQRNTHRPMRRPYRKHKGESCERCGFIPEDSCQLDVNHKDGDHNNNESNNLETLCANCHRLVTKRNRHGIYRFRE